MPIPRIRSWERSCSQNADRGCGWSARSGSRWCRAGLSQTLPRKVQGLIESFSKGGSYILGSEFLTDARSGVSTRCRETRVTPWPEAATELGMTEFVDNERVRLVSGAGGTVWDTVLTVRPAVQHRTCHGHGGQALQADCAPAMRSRTTSTLSRTSANARGQRISSVMRTLPAKA